MNKNRTQFGKEKGRWFSGIMPRSQRGCRGFDSLPVHSRNYYRVTRIIDFMKVVNGKQAAQDYMSTHTLAFSTPELTLMRFAFWLGDMVPDPQNKENAVPRVFTYIEEKDFEPVNIIDEETYVPTGAVRSTSMYGNPQTEMGTDVRFCSECGTKISGTAKFCPECGNTQD